MSFYNQCVEHQGSILLDNLRYDECDGLLGLIGGLNKDQQG